MLEIIQEFKIKAEHIIFAENSICVVWSLFNQACVNLDYGSMWNVQLRKKI